MFRANVIVIHRISFFGTKCERSLGRIIERNVLRIGVRGLDGEGYERPDLFLAAMQPKRTIELVSILFCLMHCAQQQMSRGDLRSAGLQCKVACEEYGSPGAGVYRSNTDSGY